MLLKPFIILATSLLTISFDTLAIGRPNFDTLDTNNDQKVSKKEFIEGAPSFIPAEIIFDKLDTNKDNFLDKQEIAKAKR